MSLVRHKPISQSLFVALAIVSVFMLYLRSTECAPTSTRNNAGSTTDKNSGNGARLPRASILSSLFRRQTSASNDESPSSESDIDDPQAQTISEAQKFMDSLPNPNGNNNSGPSTFRERVSDTFGLLRDGVSNHFKSIRDNFSDTVEDLRETWSE